MMFLFSKNFLRQVYRLRKQQWSAPTVMSILIIFFMILVFTFESIGLLNKEKNLDFRSNAPEKSILVIKTSAEIKIGTTIEELKKIEEPNEKVLISKLKCVNEKSKEENQEQMIKILIEGAHFQNEYNSFNQAINKETDNNFFDI